MHICRFRAALHFAHLADTPPQALLEPFAVAWPLLVA
jgi:hypothetical protein